MSTLNRALKSLQMIKFARRTNFYWRSFIDPEADAYDAVKQEILNKQQVLNDQGYTYNGHTIDATKAVAAFSKARELNDAAAARRRERVFRSTPHRVGVALGGVAGGTLGYHGSNLLANTFGLTPDKGGWRKWLGRGTRAAGTVLGTLGGAALGGNIGANWYATSENTLPFKNGTNVLKGLNKSLDSLVTDWDANAKDDEKHLNFINTNAANEARSEAKKRKEDVTAKRRTKK